MHKLLIKFQGKSLACNIIVKSDSTVDIIVEHKLH